MTNFCFLFLDNLDIFKEEKKLTEKHFKLTLKDRKYVKTLKDIKASIYTFLIENYYDLISFIDIQHQARYQLFVSEESCSAFRTCDKVKVGQDLLPTNQT